MNKSLLQLQTEVSSYPGGSNEACKVIDSPVTTPGTWCETLVTGFERYGRVLS